MSRIIKNININLNKEELLLILGNKLESEKASDTVLKNLNLLKEGKKLIEPKAIYKKLKVNKISDDGILLENNMFFKSKNFIKVMNNAEELFLSIITIGDALENKSDDYMKSGEYLKGYILDGIGSLAVEKVGQKFYKYIENNIIKKEFNCSSPLSPGENDWDIKDQDKIFSQLDAKKIGVKLNESYLMSPKKSASLSIGVGKDVIRDKDSCDFCTLRFSCTLKNVKDYRAEQL